MTVYSEYCVSCNQCQKIKKARNSDICTLWMEAQEQGWVHTDYNRDLCPECAHPKWTKPTIEDFSIQNLMEVDEDGPFALHEAVGNLQIEEENKERQKLLDECRKWDTKPMPPRRTDRDCWR